MKVFLTLILCVLSVYAAALEDEDNTPHVNGVYGWNVLQSDLSSVWMTIEEGDKLIAEYEAKEIKNKPGSPVDFHLYTQKNPTQAQTITPDSNSISNSNFNAQNPTRFIIHGWLQNYTADVIYGIRDAWLSKGACNIILVNWGRSMDDIYASAIVASPGIGKKIANLIDYLVKNHGMSLDETHLIGYSLGAHIAGYVGKQLAKGKVHTIVGLDPAIPLLLYERPEKRLNSDDAQYVESIQTNWKSLGFMRPIGKVAFYPNGGLEQPGCESDPSGKCSHERSCVYYAEAVRYNNFGSNRCRNYEDVVNDSCESQFSGVKMGDSANFKLKSGVYKVPVHNTSPYGYDA